MPGSIRAGYVLIRRELRRLLHDPAALLAIIVAPFLLAVVTSVSLGARPTIDAHLGIAGIPASLLPHTNPNPSMSVRTIHAKDAARLVRDGVITAAVVVPADRSQPVQVISGRNDTIAREVATSIARTLSSEHLAPSSVPIRAGPPGRKPLEGAEIYGPVIAVFFILFGVGSVSRGLQSQRLDGTLARLLVAPIRPGVVLAAKGVMMFFVGLTEILVVILTTTLLFHAHWGNPYAVALVSVAVVLSGIAIATAIASVTSSPRQAQGVELAIALALVGIGGHMVPVRNLPGAAQTVAHLTPNGASLDAFANIATGVGSAWSQLAPLLVVFAFTLTVGALGLLRIRKVLPA